MVAHGGLTVHNRFCSLSSLFVVADPRIRFRAWKAVESWTSFKENGRCSERVTVKRFVWATRVAQWWEHSPPNNVAWVEFVVGSLPCSERFFSGYSGFSPLLKNQHFQILVRSGTHGHVWIPKCSLGKQNTYYNYNYRVLSRIYSLGEWPKATSLLGGSGGMPPGKFLKWICAEMQSGTFETQFWEMLQCVHCSDHSIWISSRKYGLWFETLQFFCSFQSVQLILIYFVAGRSSTKPDYIVLRLYSRTSICRTSVQQSRRYKKNTVSFTLVIVKYVKKYLDITKPRYSEHILPVHWPFVISRFHCTQIFTRLVCVNGKHTW